MALEQLTKPSLVLELPLEETMHLRAIPGQDLRSWRVGACCGCWLPGLL